MNPKKHPDYDPVALSKEMITQMAEAFGRYDDRQGRAQQRMTLNEAAALFGITSLKARKILITAGVYSTAVSREVQDLYRSGRSVAEIGRMLSKPGPGTGWNNDIYDRDSYGFRQNLETAEHDREPG